MPERNAATGGVAEWTWSGQFPFRPGLCFLGMLVQASFMVWFAVFKDWHFKVAIFLSTQAFLGLESVPQWLALTRVRPWTLFPVSSIRRLAGRVSGNAIKVNSFSGQFKDFFGLIWFGFFDVRLYMAHAGLEFLILLALLLKCATTSNFFNFMF